jgi:hypothetical protein
VPGSYVRVCVVAQSGCSGSVNADIIVYYGSYRVQLSSSSEPCFNSIVVPSFIVAE